jgi:hypothetical protein
MFLKRNLHLLSYLRADKVFPTPVRWSYLCAYKALFKHFGVLMTKKHLFRRPIQSLPTYQVSQRNPRLKVRPKGLHSFAFYITRYASRFTPHEKRSTKDYVRKNNLFMQNEPKFQKVKLNVNKVLTTDYDKMDTWSIRKNEPKTNPNEPKTNPNSKRPK